MICGQWSWECGVPFEAMLATAAVNCSAVKLVVRPLADIKIKNAVRGSRASPCGVTTTTPSASTRLGRRGRSNPLPLPPIQRSTRSSCRSRAVGSMSLRSEESAEKINRNDSPPRHRWTKYPVVGRYRRGLLREEMRGEHREKSNNSLDVKCLVHGGGCPARIRTSIDGIRIRSLTIRRRGNEGGQIVGAIARVKGVAADRCEACRSPSGPSVAPRRKRGIVPSHMPACPGEFRR